MKETDIENGLKAVLGMAVLDYPIAWPNDKIPSDRPRLECNFSGGNRRGGSLKGGQIEFASGILSITVVTALNISSGKANSIGDVVAALYSEGKRIPIEGGTIVIMKPTDVRKGFKGDDDWRVPVVVTYEASKT